MRAIKKKVLITKHECLYYNRDTKQEEIGHCLTNEVYPTIPQKPNCILLESKELESVEYTYTLSPEDFLKYATIEQINK